MKNKKEFIWDTGWTMTLFGKFVHGVSGRFAVPQGSAGETGEPAMDIFEEKENVIVEIEAPGMERDDLDLSITEGRLKVEGFKRGEEDRGCLGYLCLERRFGAFRRIVPVPGSVDTSSVQAVLQDGLLRIVIPRVPEKRKSAVKVSIRKASEHSGENER